MESVWNMSLDKVEYLSGVDVMYGIILNEYIQKSNFNTRYLQFSLIKQEFAYVLNKIYTIYLPCMQNITATRIMRRRFHSHSHNI